MKAFTLGLMIFSGLAVVGLLTTPYPDSSTVWGLVYAGSIIAHGFKVLELIKEKR